MSDTLDLTTVSEEPVESNVQVEITDAPETVGPEGPIDEPVADDEEPVVDEEPVETEGPVEEESPVEEVAQEQPEAPAEASVEEEPVEEAPAEPVTNEEAPVAPVEQVAADIRNILTEVPSTTPVETSEPVVSEQLCSLKTLTNVLGKWSGGEIKKINVENLLKEGTEVDENLDDIEKVVEVIQLWLKSGHEFKKNNYFKKLDEYTLVSESRNLDSNKKNQLLGELIQFLIDCSQGKYNNEQISDFFNNFY